MWKPLDTEKKSYEKLIVPLFIVIFFAYGSHAVYPILKGPEITLITPYNGEVIEEDTFILSANIVRGREVTVNGIKINPDQNGYIETRFVTSFPYTIIEIDAIDSYGKLETKTLKVATSPSLQIENIENGIEQISKQRKAREEEERRKKEDVTLSNVPALPEEEMFWSQTQATNSVSTTTNP